MDLHSLRIYLELCNSLHFGKASSASNITPSALSRTIQRLEAEVGRTLFLRDNRSVQLTAEGVAFRQFARETLERWEHLRETLADSERTLAGEISLYCSVTASYTVLYDLLARFREHYPSIHVKLQTGDAAGAIDKVRNGEVDVTVAARPDRLPPNLEFRTMTVTPVVFIAPVVPCRVTTLTTGRDIPWKQVPMVIAEQGLSRRRVDAWFRAKGIRPVIYAEVAGHEAIIPMVRLGCGVGVVPRLVLEKSAFKDEVRLIDVSPPLEPYNVGLCAHRRRLASAVVRALWETATENGR